MTTIRPRTTTLRIYQGDYPDRLEQLQREADEAAAAVLASRVPPSDGLPRTLDEAPTAATPDASSYEAKRREYQALVDEAKADAIEVTLTALGRRKFREMVLAHPARVKGEPGVRDADADLDALVGVNEETFRDELVAASITEPAFSSRAATDEFTDSLADADFERIYYAAFALNRNAAADPKSLPTMPATVQSDEI